MKNSDLSPVLKKYEQTKERTIVIIDFGNVQKWEVSLGWKVGIKQLKDVIKHFSAGKKFLRKFYYGSDFGMSEQSTAISLWSGAMLHKARMNDFEIVTKRVKYIPDSNYRTGYIKKCNFDIEIAVDLFRELGNYETIILFSGDGDFSYLLRHLKQYGKRSVVFGARGHVGKELYDAHRDGIVDSILYAEDFEHRLNMERFRL